MAGEDLTSSRFSEPALDPVPTESLDRAALLAWGERIVTRTWADGLPQWFWGEGVCLAGIVEFHRAAGLPFPAEVLAWLGDRAHDARLEHVNNVAPGIAAALAVSAGAEGLAPAAGRLADWVANAPEATRTVDGVLEHWPGGVWADTAFMAGGFLTRWSRATGDVESFAEALRQVLGHYRILQHPERGLCAHGSHRGEVIWCFWGRANAWLALAAVGVLETAGEWAAVPAALTGDLAELSDRLSRQLDALVAHQPDHGVWDVLVDGQPENRGVLETSAAAGIGAAMLRASRVVPGGERWAGPGSLAVRGSLAYVRDGALTRVSAGTVLQLIPFGYSVIRDDRPQLWGQGLALHAIAAALG